jgi:hypothetical protein
MPNWLTPPAILAAGNINKELTARRGFDCIVPVITIRLVNGILMAKRRFLRT